MPQTKEQYRDQILDLAYQAATKAKEEDDDGRMVETNKVLERLGGLLDEALGISGTA